MKPFALALLVAGLSLAGVACKSSEEAKTAAKTEEAKTEAKTEEAKTEAKTEEPKAKAPQPTRVD